MLARRVWIAEISFRLHLRLWGGLTRFWDDFRRCPWSFLELSRLLFYLGRCLSGLVDGPGDAGQVVQARLVVQLVLNIVQLLLSDLENSEIHFLEFVLERRDLFAL